jgi:hypothetical protein
VYRIWNFLGIGGGGKREKVSLPAFDVNLRAIDLE